MRDKNANQHASRRNNDMNAISPMHCYNLIGAAHGICGVHAIMLRV